MKRGRPPAHGGYDSLPFSRVKFLCDVLARDDEHALRALALFWELEDGGDFRTLIVRLARDACRVTSERLNHDGG